MITYYNRHHALHQGRLEMFRGEMVPCFEVPARADQVLLELQRRKLGPVLDPHTFDDALLARVHSPRYLAFLASAWDQWLALDADNAQRGVLPSFWPARGLRNRGQIPINSWIPDQVGHDAGVSGMTWVARLG